MTTDVATPTPLLHEDPFPEDIGGTTYLLPRRSVACTAITRRSAIVGAIAEMAAALDAVLTPLEASRGRLSWIEALEPCWDWPAEEMRSRDERPTLAKEALAALADIQRWLHCSQAQAATLVGVAERTIPNWKAGRSPHPSSVRKLFAVHGLLRSLTLHLGSNEMLVWLSDLSADGGTRLELLHQEDGVARAIREARPILFPPPFVPGFLSSDPDAAEGEEPATPPPYPQHAHGDDVPRARRVP